MFEAHHQYNPVFLKPMSVDRSPQMQEAHRGYQQPMLFPEPELPQYRSHAQGFPVPQEYPLGSPLPDFQVRPKQPIGRPDQEVFHIRADDINPRKETLDLLDRSFGKVRFCREVFSSLAGGMGGLANRGAEKAIRDKIAALYRDSDVAFEACRTLCRNCTEFHELVNGKLRELACEKGAAPPPCSDLQQKYDELLAALWNVQQHVELILTNIIGLMRTLGDAKSSAHTRTLQNVRNWLAHSFESLLGKSHRIRAAIIPAGIVMGPALAPNAYCLASQTNDCNVQKVLDVLGKVLVEDMKLAETSLISFNVAYENLTKSLLDVVDKASARLDFGEGTLAREQWLIASEKITSIERTYFRPTAQMRAKWS